MFDGWTARRIKKQTHKKTKVVFFKTYIERELKDRKLDSQLKEEEKLQVVGNHITEVKVNTGFSAGGGTEDGKVEYRKKKRNWKTERVNWVGGTVWSDKSFIRLKESIESRSE